MIIEPTNRIDVSTPSSSILQVKFGSLHIKISLSKIT
jgi:hypothetical protein